MTSSNAISPRDTASAGASGRSVSVIGCAIVIMPSCTTPTFSKMLVTCQATQPDMLTICQDIGSAIATVPTSIWPRVHSTSASAPVLVTIMALSDDSVSPNSVLSRSEAWNMPVCSSIASRT